jgi:hypothetical protein
MKEQQCTETTRQAIADRIAIGTELAKEKDLICGQSTVTRLLTVINVLMKVPKETDKFLKLVPANKFYVPENEGIDGLTILKIPKHYRRGDFYQGRMVTRNFYVSEESLGKTILSSLAIKLKKHLLTGKETITIDIFLVKSPDAVPQHVVKIGADSTARARNGEKIISDGNRKLVVIPGTTKFISVEKISAPSSPRH